MALIIKFSHRYLKMPEGFERSQLLDVISIDLKDLSKPFRDYDTSFDGGSYPLPKSGKYIILMLLSEKGHLWTTIRSAYPPKKASYYLENIGHIFNCVIVRDVRPVYSITS
jgi:hypothetical protein